LWGGGLYADHAKPPPLSLAGRRRRPCARSVGAGRRRPARNYDSAHLERPCDLCEAPLEIAEQLLRAEGFTDVRYVDTSTDDLSTAIASI